MTDFKDLAGAQYNAWCATVTVTALRCGLRSVTGATDVSAQSFAAEKRANYHDASGSTPDWRQYWCVRYTLTYMYWCAVHFR